MTSIWFCHSSMPALSTAYVGPSRALTPYQRLHIHCNHDGGGAAGVIGGGILGAILGGPLGLIAGAMVGGAAASPGHCVVPGGSTATPESLMPDHPVFMPGGSTKDR